MNELCECMGAQSVMDLKALLGIMALAQLAAVGGLVGLISVLRQIRASQDATGRDIADSGTNARVEIECRKKRRERRQLRCGTGETRPPAQ